MFYRDHNIHCKFPGTGTCSKIQQTETEGEWEERKGKEKNVWSNHFKSTTTAPAPL